MYEYVLIFLAAVVIVSAAVMLIDEKSKKSDLSALRMIDDRTMTNAGKIKDLAQKLSLLDDCSSKSFETIGKVIEEKVSKHEGPIKSLLEEVDALHDYCAALRSEMLTLRNEVASKKPLFQVDGPIPVEIYTPKKNLGVQTKKVRAKK